MLLLDEVAAHLDPLRRAALYARLAGQGGQAWLTGTEAELFASMRGPVTRFAIAGDELPRASISGDNFCANLAVISDGAQLIADCNMILRRY